MKPETAELKNKTDIYLRNLLWKLQNDSASEGDKSMTYRVVAELQRRGYGPSYFNPVLDQGPGLPLLICGCGTQVQIVKVEFSEHYDRGGVVEGYSGVCERCERDYRVEKFYYP